MIGLTEINDFVNLHWPVITGLLVVVILAITMLGSSRKKKKAAEELKKEVITARIKETTTANSLPDDNKPPVFQELFNNNKAEDNKEGDIYSGIKKINNILQEQEKEVRQRVAEEILSLKKELEESEVKRIQIEKYGADLVKMYKNNESRIEQIITSLRIIEVGVKPSEGRKEVSRQAKNDYYDHSDIELKPSSYDDQGKKPGS